jgi:hypothetical protein
VKPSAGCLDAFGKAGRTTPLALCAAPLLRGNVLIKRSAAAQHEKLPEGSLPAAHLLFRFFGTRLMFPHLGKLFILLGAAFLAVGLWLTFAPHVSLGKLGRLPGDIHIKRDNFTFYFPLTTCILVSLLLTLIFSILSRK